MQYAIRALLVLSVTYIASAAHVYAGHGILSRLFRGRQVCTAPRSCVQPCLQKDANCVPIVEHAVPSEEHVVHESDSVSTDEESVDFPAIAEQLVQAETVTMTVTPYMSFSTRDETRTWIQSMGRSQLAFRTPHFYRDTRFRRGLPFMVQIVDAKSEQSLMLQVPVKKAIKMDSAINVYGTDEPNPLAALGRMFAEKPPEFIETREVNGRSVDVYRYIREPRKTTLDIWIDSKSGSLFAISDPGSDQLDISKVTRAADAPAGRDRGRGQRAGVVRSDIRINEPLDAELFSLEVPKGYELMEARALPGGPINPQ